ncbi:hypothetical protein RF16_21090 [Salmonella enterica subsp. enterica]|nr:hypothetical protein [Salmonella enterica subsp. enterica]EDX5007249.1 hypothetical protein [Salmonella enterica subsp. houtenae]EGO0678668.1 hypothetical protein [Salmonella enterica]EEJ7380850.1 hypothetical protein [Salmonella enterica subsp. enterica]EGO0733658.1 hypothetical protein [Salmonella enterica]
MQSLQLTKKDIPAVNALYSVYMIYLLYRNLSNIVFILTLVNFLLFIVTHKFYCASNAIFLCYIYFSSGISQQARKAGEQAIRYLDLLLSASSISDVNFLDAVDELNKIHLMIPSGLLRGRYIFIMISARVAPLTIAKARRELTMYEKLVIWLAGGLPVDHTDIKVKISLNSINYKIALSFD